MHTIDTIYAVRVNKVYLNRKSDTYHFFVIVMIGITLPLFNLASIIVASPILVVLCSEGAVQSVRQFYSLSQIALPNSIPVS
jgi:hypothetical protein